MSVHDCFHRMRSASLLSFIFIINKCYGTIDKLFDVIWTNQHEAEILTEEEHKIAFRDIVLEGYNLIRCVQIEITSLCLAK